MLAALVALGFAAVVIACGVLAFMLGRDEARLAQDKARLEQKTEQYKSDQQLLVENEITRLEAVVKQNDPSAENKNALDEETKKPWPSQN